MGVPVTFSSREFNQQLHKAKQAAKRGPVIITDRGEPAHVLLSYEEYRRLSAPRGSIIDLLAMPAEAGLDDFEFPTLPVEYPRVPDLSD